jgi:hypothetical protein
MMGRRRAATGAAGIVLAGVLACGETPRGGQAGGDTASTVPPPPARADTGRPAPASDSSTRISPELAVRALARVENDSLATRLVVINTSPDSVPVNHGACALVVRVYRGEGAAPRLAWRSDVPEPFAAIGCPAVAFHLRLAPHQEYAPLELRSAIPIDSILGDSLPDGAYRIGVTSDLGPRPVELSAGVIPLKRSSGRLRRPERRRGG